MFGEKTTPERLPFPRAIARGPIVEALQPRSSIRPSQRRPPPHALRWRVRPLTPRCATKFFESLPCDPIPSEAADHYARIKTAGERLGLPLDENDLWIAATTVTLGATLVTSDSDFSSIDGLPVRSL